MTVNIRVVLKSKLMQYARFEPLVTKLLALEERVEGYVVSISCGHLHTAGRKEILIFSLPCSVSSQIPAMDPFRTFILRTKPNQTHEE